MKCKYCGEKDESKLALSSRLVDGKVEHAYVCLRCLWVKLSSVIDTRNEDGILSESELCKRLEPDRSINPTALPDRAKFKQ